MPDRVDELARVLVAPLSRRETLRLAAGVLLGGVAAPHVFTYGALAQRATTCEEAQAASPCTGTESAACCVNADPPPGFVVPIASQRCYDPTLLHCCRVRREDGSPAVVLCEKLTERCGAGGTGNNCECLIECAGRCCPPDTDCRGGRCLKRCPAGWTGSGDGCCPPGMTKGPTGRGGCTCAKGQLCGDSCCPFGFACTPMKVLYEDLPEGSRSRSVCAGPPDADGRFDSTIGYPILPRVGTGLISAPQASDRSSARVAKATPPFARELVAVAAQGAAALAAWATPLTDTGKARARTPKVTVRVDGLSGPARTILLDLLLTEARANAALLAAGRARGRAVGALAKRNRKRAIGHSRDSGRLAATAATGYAKLPAKRAAAAAALRGAGIAEIRVGPEDVQAAKRALARGLPAATSAALTRLGLSASDRRRATGRIAAGETAAAIGPVLIAPLEDEDVSRAYTDLAQSLRMYAAAARRQPIAQGLRTNKSVPREVA